MQPVTLSQPLPSVQFPFASFLGGAASQQFLPILVAVIFILWAVYTAVVAYHWMRYANHTIYAIPAIGVFVFVSLAIAGYALSGFH
jgi:hypothetical protein